MRILSFIVSIFLVFGMVFMPSTSKAGIFVSINIAPPALPVYVQPASPSPDYIWTPGYWAYNSFFGNYYWVAGAWVMAPSVGLLWTPGYWGWSGGNYSFNDGYWGENIGFYGGINYGYGYGGRGYSGGSWSHGRFVNKTVYNTNTTNATNTTVNNVSSFNGGPGGTKAQPTSTERVAMHEKHFPATVQQNRNVQTAGKNTVQRTPVNEKHLPATVQQKMHAQTASKSIVQRASAPHAQPKQRIRKAQVKRPLPKAQVKRSDEK